MVTPRIAPLWSGGAADPPGLFFLDTPFSPFESCVHSIHDPGLGGNSRDSSLVGGMCPSYDVISTLFRKKKSPNGFAQNAGGPKKQLALFCILNGSCLIKGVVRSVSGSGKTLETNDTFIFFRDQRKQRAGDRSVGNTSRCASLGSTRSRTLRAVKSERVYCWTQVLSRTVEDSEVLVLKSKSHTSSSYNDI